MKKPPEGGHGVELIETVKLAAPKFITAHMTTIAGPKGDRLSSIDSMRGIAILMVIATHAAGWIAPSSPWLQHLAEVGARGVQLFYVLSAYSLFLSYEHRKSRGDFSLKDYFIRRLARIAPMFWVAIALHTAASGMGARYWAPDGITWGDVALTAVFLNGWSPTTITSVVPGGWSVAIETTFYMVLPIFFLWVRSLKSALLVTFICMAAAGLLGAWYFGATVGSFPEAQRYLVYSFAWQLWLPAQLPVFMLGIVLYFAREKLSAIPDGLGLLWVALALLLLAAARSVSIEGPVSNQLISGVGFLFLALAMLKGEAPALDNKVLRSIGKISFSAYLLHFLVLKVFDFAARKFGFPTSPSDFFYLISLSATIAATAAASTVTYRLVELPGIAIGHRLISQARSTKRQPA